MTQSNFLKKAQNISKNIFFVKGNIVAQNDQAADYFRYRMLRPILKGYYKLFNLFYPNRPWTTPASIIFFEKALSKDMIGLEYGSGRSTLYFAKKLKKLVSIEHHREWHKNVSNTLKNEEINNVDYLFIPKKPNENSFKDVDAELNKLDGSESRLDFEDYYLKVKEYPDDFFDFVLIDGRVRVHCGINAISKLKSGGIFVLDNAERPRYAPLHQALDKWPKVETTTGLTDTTIWIKP